jgi:predicted PurR-regulated permease PerM
VCGLALFGAAGLILGPLVVVMTIEVLAIWRERARAAEAGEEEERDEVRFVPKPAKAANKSSRW